MQEALFYTGTLAESRSVMNFSQQVLSRMFFIFQMRCHSEKQVGFFPLASISTKEKPSHGPRFVFLIFGYMSKKLVMHRLDTAILMLFRQFFEKSDKLFFYTVFLWFDKKQMGSNRQVNGFPVQNVHTGKDSWGKKRSASGGTLGSRILGFGIKGKN